MNRVRYLNLRPAFIITYQILPTHLLLTNYPLLLLNRQALPFLTWMAHSTLYLLIPADVVWYIPNIPLTVHVPLLA